ncbi:MAG TPA: hypothetical protein VFM27_14020 [Acidimicrobiales bacterium]|nr:hypothetical protein [Acidimicrobiales bacterium]
MTDTPDEGATPVEQLREHLDEVTARPDEMQERLDELGETIEATRRQAEADDLLPGPGGEPEGDPAGDQVGSPEGDESVDTPASDTDAPAPG